MPSLSTMAHQNTTPQAKSEDIFKSGTVRESTPKPLPKSGLWQGMKEEVKAVWENLQTNHLWQRMLKNTLATIIVVILGLTPAVVDVYGRAVYLAAMTTVFGHPGRRFGQMAEALILTILGTLLGTAWSTLGIFLSNLLYGSNEPAAYTIKGIFLVVAAMLHGFLRSHTPRLFILALLMIIVSVVSLTSTATAVSATLITTLLYPILTAVGLILIINVCVFPEFSSSFLGITTIETLGETVGAVRNAGIYFVSTSSPSGVPTEQRLEDDGSAVGPPIGAKMSAKKVKSDPAPSSIINKLISIIRRGKKDSQEKKENQPPEAARPKKIKLKSLTDAKAKLRAKLDSCKSAQQECNFELAFAVLPPRDLKPINDIAMKKLVANTIALISACESRYALMGDEGNTEEESKDHEQLERPNEIADLDTSQRESSVDISSDDEKENKKNKGGKLDTRRKKRKDKTRLMKEIEDLELVKPRKEIEFGDAELLKVLVKRISQPLTDLQDKIDRSVDVVTSCLAYCYDVPKLPDGSRPPKGIKLEEMDIWADTLRDAITNFDKDSASALEGAAAPHHLDSSEADIMPRMETFLVCSFLLNLRQAALHVHEMLAKSRKLVEKRQSRHERRRIYAPRINWHKWLRSGGEEDMFALPSKGRKDARTGTMRESPEDDENARGSNENLVAKLDDEEAAIKKSVPARPQLAIPAEQEAKEAKENQKLTHRIRNNLADTVEYVMSSEDVLYSVKLTVAVFIVTWPAFVTSWNLWFSLNRGFWAALQLILITEVAIGNSIFVFIVRAAGTTLGCVWGYVAYQAGSGDRIICVVFLVIGILPSTYVQLGTKFVKAGMVSIISMCIVALATEDQTVPGTATENFLRRLIAFLIGGVVALIVELTLFPVKARDRLVESLAASIRQISEMEACLAYGIETEINIDANSPGVSERFERAKSKAQGALTAAETFLPFCAQEPRLKGSFAGLALVYTEILYVLHQIVDRMDNMLQLRDEYGSSVIEELNAHLFPYRRNIASSITLTLFAAHEALTTKLPLPQFLPSARLAHLRMVNRVREVMLTKASGPRKRPNVDGGLCHESVRPQVELSLVKRIVRRKFLSWNAASAGRTEVIEYLEELTDLVKLLVGANEFRSGMLTRPTYREYMEHPGVNSQEKSPKSEKTGIDRNKMEMEIERGELRDTLPATRKLGLTRRRSCRQTEGQIEKTSTSRADDADAAKRSKMTEEDDLPRSLQRVRSRRVEEKNERLGKATTRQREEEQWTTVSHGKKTI